MKTIITTLPIYDRIEKQLYQRSKGTGQTKPIPIVCPRHRLPSFQWKDNGDGCTSVERVEAVNKDYTGVETSLSGSWYGIGLHNNFDTFVSAGLNITSAITIAGGGYADSSVIPIVKDAEYILRGTLTVNSGDAPYILCSALSPNSIQLTAGSVEIVFRGAKTGNATLTIYSPTASNFAFTTVTFVKVEDAVALDVYMPSKPSLVTIGLYDYFIYEYETLNYLLPTGEYYLKITMDNGYIYYSEWFLVDCVYENLISSWQNAMYNSFDSSGTTINAVVSGITGGTAASNRLNLYAGEKVTLIFNLIYLTSPAGEAPSFTLYDLVTFHEETYSATEGLNEIEFTTEGSNAYLISIANTNTTSWQISEAMLIREYSSKYLILNFSNSCDFGDIIYQDGFTQTLYFESEPMEPSFPTEEQGANNGEGKFIRTFARQVKKYLARTKEMPEYMVDVFNRMRLHDTIELIDLVGDENDVYNLEETHEYLWDDKYYVRFDLTFDYDEAVVISGCCNNVT